MSARGLGRAAPGDRVRLTGYYLRATGQMKSDDGRKRWTVLECSCGLCKGGEHVAVDEPHDDEYRRLIWGDLPEAQRPKWRHVSLASLERIGYAPKAEDQGDAVPSLRRY